MSPPGSAVEHLTRIRQFCTDVEAANPHAEIVLERELDTITREASTVAPRLAALNLDFRAGRARIAQIAADARDALEREVGPARSEESDVGPLAYALMESLPRLRRSLDLVRRGETGPGVPGEAARFEADMVADHLVSFDRPSNGPDLSSWTQQALDIYGLVAVATSLPASEVDEAFDDRTSHRHATDNPPASAVSGLSGRREALLRAGVWFLEHVGDDPAGTDRDDEARRAISLGLSVDQAVAELASSVVGEPTLSATFEQLAREPLVVSTPDGLQVSSLRAFDSCLQLAAGVRTYIAGSAVSDSELVSQIEGFENRNAAGVDVDLFVNAWWIARSQVWERPGADRSRSVHALAAALVFCTYVLAGPWADHPARPALPAMDRVTPIARSGELAHAQRQLINAGLEPLVEAAQRLLDRGKLDVEDAAYLQALLDATQAENRNPRPDVVALERDVVRLAEAVSRFDDDDQRSTRLVATLDLEPGQAAAHTERLRGLIQGTGLGDIDDAADLDRATAFLQSVADELDSLLDDVSATIEQNPHGAVTERLATRDAQLSRRPGDWRPAIGQNLVAAAIWEIFNSLGGLGAAAKAVIWLLVAIYNAVPGL